MKNFQKTIQSQFTEMCKTGKLFTVDLTGQQIWNLYLTSFESDPIFRDPESSIHNCNHCNNFIRRYGNIVSIDENYNVVSLFDIEAKDEFISVTKALSKAIKNSKIKEVFFETFNELNSLPYEKCTKASPFFQLGIDKNVKRYTKEEAEKFGVVKTNELRTFGHMFLNLPNLFVNDSGDSIAKIMDNYRKAKEVFQRAMLEISIDTLSLVKDLINQGSLLDGQTHLYKIEQIIPLKKEYDNLAENQKDNWCWINSYQLSFAKFKNELIGVLCSELSEGEELNKACQSWNKRVDPANYMKATAPITQKQIAEAQKFAEENRYVESFDRRFAILDDIKADEILHLGNDEGKIKEVSIFDNVKGNKSRHKRNEFEGIEEISIEKFMKDILPECASIEAFLKNNHESNMVSLLTANKPNSKPIFKWPNNYNWTFNGNLAGKSQIKEAVKGRGGKVDGCLNVRLHFPNTESDYDLHLTEPTGYRIFYQNRRQKSAMSGMLDLDAQGADGSFPPEKRVENIIYDDISQMSDGIYKVQLHNYCENDRNKGFNIEIETSEGIAKLHYDQFINNGYKIDVADIELKNGEFEIKANTCMQIGSLEEKTKEIYGLETNNFHKVNLVCLSPNHWNGNSIGNKHYLFMLDNCKTPSNIRSFHSENLIPELATHRKVLEVLGATNMIEPSDKQLSGLGFNATVKDELIVKLTGNFKRVIKIKF